MPGAGAAIALSAREMRSTFLSSYACVGRQAGERVVSATRWQRGRHTRGSNSRRIFDVGEAELMCPAAKKIAFASRSRAARFHQPADAGPFAWFRREPFAWF